jgi:hypothetical protein
MTVSNLHASIKNSLVLKSVTASQRAVPLFGSGWTCEYSYRISVIKLSVNKFKRTPAYGKGKVVPVLN